MTNKILIDQTINTFKRKSIIVDGDKSLSIRFVLFSSLSKGKCTATKLLVSEDVKSAIKIIKKLGIKIKLRNDKCEIFGRRGIVCLQNFGNSQKLFMFIYSENIPIIISKNRYIRKCHNSLGFVSI